MRFYKYLLILTLLLTSYSLQAAAPCGSAEGLPCGTDCPNGGPTNVGGTLETVGGNCQCIPSSEACPSLTVDCGSYDHQSKPQIACRYFYRPGEAVPIDELESCYQVKQVDKVIEGKSAR